MPLSLGRCSYISDLLQADLLLCDLLGVSLWFCKQTPGWNEIFSDGLDDSHARNHSFHCKFIPEKSQTLELEFGKVWKCSLIVLALLLSARPGLWYLAIKSAQRRTRVIDFFVVKCFR